MPKQAPCAQGVDEPGRRPDEKQAARSQIEFSDTAISLAGNAARILWDIATHLLYTAGRQFGQEK
jgi:hypothetical protein